MTNTSDKLDSSFVVVNSVDEIGTKLLSSELKTIKMFYCSEAVTQFLTGGSTHTGRGFCSTTTENIIDYFIISASNTAYQGRYNISTGNVAYLREFTYKTNILNDISEMFYTGSRSLSPRGIAVGISGGTALFTYHLPTPCATGTPSVTVNDAGVTGIGTVTAVLDTSRSNKYCLTFQLTRSSGSFTNNASYFCYVSFTI